MLQPPKGQFQSSQPRRPNRSHRQQQPTASVLRRLSAKRASRTEQLSLPGVLCCVVSLCIFLAHATVRTSDRTPVISFHCCACVNSFLVTVQDASPISFAPMPQDFTVVSEHCCCWCSCNCLHSCFRAVLAGLYPVRSSSPSDECLLCCCS